MRFPFAQGASEAVGTATQSDVLSGTTFSTSQLIGASGTMPNNGAVTLNPSGLGTVAIPAGYHDGSGVVAEVSVPASDVLTGTTIAGVGGTMPNQGSPTLQPGQSITSGYYGGGSAAAPTSGIQYFNSPGSYTFTVPSGVTRIIGAMWGAGGGGSGGGLVSSPVGPGGGAGALVVVLFNVSPGDVLNLSVGAGGLGGPASTSGAPSSSQNGQNGGSTSITASGITWVSGGGQGGTYNGSVALGGTIPYGQNQLLYIPGGYSGMGAASNPGGGSPGGNGPGESYLYGSSTDTPFNQGGLNEINPTANTYSSGAATSSGGIGAGGSGGWGTASTSSANGSTPGGGGSSGQSSSNSSYIYGAGNGACGQIQLFW